MIITNNTGLPEALVLAVQNDPYDPGDSDISVTQLAGPPQKAILTRQHWDEIIVDAADMLYALLGQAVHSILERANTSMLAEERVYARIEDWKVGGQFDLFDPKSGVLWDYKIASVWEYINGVKPERAAQLNSLACLLVINGHVVTSCKAVFLFRDWSRSKSIYDRSYPRHQVMIVDVGLWSFMEQLQYLHERVDVHKRARQGFCLPCTDEERWVRPTKWAVMKKGRKSALRVLDSEDEALAWQEVNGGDYIDERKGEAVRCETYCAAAPFCEQFKQEKAK